MCGEPAAPGGVADSVALEGMPGPASPTAGKRSLCLDFGPQWAIYRRAAMPMPKPKVHGLLAAAKRRVQADAMNAITTPVEATAGKFQHLLSIVSEPQKKSCAGSGGYAAGTNGSVYFVHSRIPCGGSVHGKVWV